MRRDGSSLKFDLFIIIAVSLMVRALFLFWMPPAAVSSDMQNWIEVTRILEQGGNPYTQTPHLPHPPFWIQILYLVTKVSGFTGVSVHRLIQMVLILAECALTAVLCLVVHKQGGIRKYVLLGMSLNPICILLTCQHCNFDAFVGLWILLFLMSLLDFSETSNPAKWLTACAFLGMGILTKQVAIVLVPLLLNKMKIIAQKTRVLGILLVAGPTILGLSIVYVLSSEEAIKRIIGYRSAVGHFGITGLIRLSVILFHNHEFLQTLYLAYAKISTYFILGTVVLAGMWIWRRPPLDSKQMILVSAMLLAMIPAVGRGYGPQYIFWFLPLLVCSYALDGDRKWRTALLCFYGIAVMTYIFEYALFRSHGSFLVILSGSEMVERLSAAVSGQTGQTLIRLPLFFCYLSLLYFGGRRILP